MTLLQLQLCRVFDRDDALIAWYVAGHHVEESGLAAARTTADQNVRPRHHTCFEKAKGALAAAPEVDEVFHAERSANELADVEKGPVDRHRGNRRVNPRAVGQSRIADTMNLITSSTSCSLVNVIGVSIRRPFTST